MVLAKSQSNASGVRVQSLLAVMCALLVAPGEGMWMAAARAQTPDAAAPQAAAKLPPEQLDSLVAPIALYPDPMLSQTLVASTYPLEIVQLQQWLQQNKTLKDKALADAVKKQSWDPSIQAMAGLPDVVKYLAENIQWTADLGNAFLAQQEDVMEAVQRMRKKAQEKGNLKTTEQQKVEVKVVESKQVVVIEQANPQVVYVPSYNPTVVYGPPVYAYPPIVYPPPPPPGAYVATAAISFGVGVAMGAMWSGGWGYHCGWGGGGNNIYVNNNNNFNRNTNINNVNRSGGNRVNAGNTSWQHNPQHRGGAPYSDRATANKYGGSARGDSLSTRQNAARQNQARAGSRPGASTMDRGAGGRGGSNPGMSNRAGGAGGGGDRVGNRQVSSSPGGSSRSAFSGSSGSGSGARASSQRGASSFSGSRGGGGGRSGGGGGRRR